MRDPRYDVLFEPLQLGPVRTRNRFYVVPHACGLSHLAPNGAIAFRETKAAGGWGVVSTQITEIGPDTDLGSHPTERIWDEQDLPYHHKVTERIHAHGALAAIELGHAGTRARNLQTGVPIIGPSVQPSLRPELPFYARAMTRDDIRKFRQAHRDAALRARTTGYDIVYVYAAHDISLLSNFLSRRTNHRTDEYGGTLENRVRLLREVLEDTKAAVGDRCAVALRFGVHEFVSQYAITSDGEGRDVVGMLAEIPDLWDVNVSGWSYDSSSSRLSEEGFQEQYTGFVKSMTSKPVVGVGRYTSPDRMVSLIRKGVFDLIGAARASIADPYLPRKIEEGRLGEIRECIGCNHCVATESYGVAIRCTQNPTVNEEWRRGWHPEEVPSAPRTESILVVGAGPAGLEFALTAARAGHHVSLCDARDELGGRVLLESRLPGLAAWRRLIDYRLFLLRQMPNVDLYPGSRLSAEDIAEFAAQRVVLATGAAWRRDGIGSTHLVEIPGLESAAVFTPDDLAADAQLPQRVLVYDDDHDYMGSVVAEHLARRGCRVVLATPLPELSAWTDYKLERDRIVARLCELGVETHIQTRIERVESGVVHTRVGPGGNALAIPCEVLWLVCSRRPAADLQSELLALSFDASRVQVIGDGLAPGTLQAAVYSGHAAAMALITGREHEQFRRDRATLEV
jgi:dimethylamine/trimethylamine dehydrogenase